MKKPDNVVYWVDETPPRSVTLLSALQHVALVSAYLVYPVLIFRAAGLETEQVANLLSIGFLVLGVGCVLQAWPKGPVGSGFLCPATFTAAFIGPGVAAIKLGGLPLLFGMTLLSGVIQSLLSRVLHFLRPILPTELSGFVVLMVGLTAGMAGARNLFGSGGETASTPVEWTIALGTLALMIGLGIWGSGLLRIVCMLAAMAAGYVAAAAAGLVSDETLGRISAASLLDLPSFAHVAWSFDASLVIPFAIATLATTLKAMGTITLAQRTNDAEWVRPHMGSTRRGVLADGLTIALAGLTGTYGTNASSSNVAMASATGVTSRRVAYATGGVFVVLGFVPLLGTLVALMPRPVMAAALLFAACFLVVNGMQIITSRMLDTRKTLVIGLAFTAGLAVEIFPAVPGIHPLLAPLMSSSLVTGTLTALALNLAFRIGVRQTVRLVITPEPGTATEIENFFKRHGAAWGARPDVVSRATFATVQLAETVGEHCAPRGPIELEASFDEFNLDVRMAYEGEPLEFPMTRPTNEEIRTSDAGLRRLAGYMLRRNANRIDSTFGAGRVSVHFHFDH